jgi:type VI protein secretion system component Hcp
MRNLMFIFLLMPLFMVAQKQDVLIKVVDVNGQQIKGDALIKGFERWINALSIASGGKNNNQLNFSTAIGASSADFKRAMANGELLTSAQVTVLASTQNSMMPVILYTIKLEKIRVSACSEVMGCNAAMNTTVTFQATRIGWTYYEQSKTGIQTVSRRFGWDAENNKEWTNF